jgi:hypothetical protein
VVSYIYMTTEHNIAPNLIDPRPNVPRDNEYPANVSNEAFHTGTIVGDLGETAVSEAVIDVGSAESTPAEPEAPVHVTPEVEEQGREYAVNTMLEQVQKRRVQIARQPEPAYGYLSSVLSSGSQHARLGGEVKETKEIHRKIAAEHDTSEYSLTEKYVLGETGTKPTDYSEPYFSSRIQSVLEGTAVDKEGNDVELEDLMDPTSPGATEDLQNLTRLFIQEGLVDFTQGRGQGSIQLQAAAKVLAEATKLIPDFDPLQAGLEELMDRTAVFRAASQAEAPHYAYSRMGAHMQGDAVGETINTCYDAAVEAMATHAGRVLQKAFNKFDKKS